MHASSIVELFEGEYTSLLRFALSNEGGPSLDDFVSRLVKTGVSLPMLCSLHSRVLANPERISLSEAEKAGEFFADILVAFDGAREKKQPTVLPLECQTAFDQQLFDDHPLPMWLFEEESLRFLRVNNAAIETYGFSREEFLSMTILDIRPEEDCHLVREFISHRPTGDPAKGEWRHHLKDGRAIDVEISSRGFLFEGKAVRLVVARDITQQKQTREALTQTEDRLRFAVEGAGIGTWHWNLVTQTVFWSPIYRSIFGHSPDESANLDTWWQSIHPDDYERVNQTIQNSLSSTDGAFRLEYRFRHSSGQWKHALARGHVFFSSTGIPLWMEGILLDNTERKNDETRLHLLELAINKANEVILITEAGENDPPGPRIIYVNEAFERMTGYSREEAVGKTPRLLQGPGTSEETRRSIRKALEEWRSITVELLNYRKDGTEFWVELAIQPIPDATGWYTHWLAIQRDVTERRREEARLRHAQKMEAIGQLAAGIAHNFNNLLTIVQGNAELIGRLTPITDSLTKKKNAILTATRRGTDLVRQLMVISRGGTGIPRPLDVNRLVIEIESLIAGVLPPNIRLSLQLADEPLYANFDSAEFSQSLLNLIVNARDAMPHGGSLTITTRLRELFDDGFDQNGTLFVFDREKIRSGTFVEVTVGDSGTGIPEQVLVRIFEPFFTTKPDGQGTGLGLATTLGFISERGGFIEVSTEMGKGTTFRLLLPESQVVPAQVQNSVPRLVSGVFPGLTALVAEDDLDVRNLVRFILEERGFRVLPAKDGLDAIRMASECPDPIQLVLTDKEMPNLYGDAVIRILSDLRPECRFILMSGGLGAQENLPEHVHFLPKPFGGDGLVSAIRTVMGR
jgi:PAS domain S-box-containing protein